MPGPPSLVLLEPSVDARFNPENAVNLDTSPQEAAELRIDVTVQNYRGTVGYLESLREPSVAAAFQETLVAGMRRVGEAINDRRDRFLAAESIEVVETVVAELLALDAEVTEDIRTAARALAAEAFDALADRSNCLERLRIDDLDAES